MRRLILLWAVAVTCIAIQSGAAPDSTDLSVLSLNIVSPV